MKKEQIELEWVEKGEDQPETILTDEPELGFTIMVSLIKSVSTAKQVIISTQSVELLSEFFADDLGDWLNQYSLGELWRKNILGGRVSL